MWSGSRGQPSRFDRQIRAIAVVQETFAPLLGRTLKLAGLAPPPAEATDRLQEIPITKSAHAVDESDESLGFGPYGIEPY